MHEPNVQRILAGIDDHDVVVDIGGWALPFNRADYVIDAMPYETRGSWAENYRSGHQGGDAERFTADTWLQRDICEHKPFPFEDKSIDFVICSHVLEDIRDPIWVCSEMNRVAKRGYIEVPSRLAESSCGVEPGIAGWSHHRWLIDIDVDSDGLTFTPKYHLIHRSRRFHFSDRFYYQLSDVQRVQWLFWDRSFSFGERTIDGIRNIESDLAAFVDEHKDAAAGRGSTRNYLADRARRTAWRASARVRG